MRNCKQIIFYSCWSLMIGCAKKPIQIVANSATQIVDTLAGLRILTYNIHHAYPPSRPGIIDINAIANVIKQQQPDIVALREVEVYTKRSGKSLHEANELARLTGMQAYFAKAINYQGGEYGVAVLSKLPLEATTNHPLPTANGTNGEARTLGTAIITLPRENKILFAFTHLDAQSNAANRLLQIRRIASILQTGQLPVIIAGDFNEAPSSEVINILDSSFTRFCITGCGFTIPVTMPNKTIDFIAFKTSVKFIVTEHKVIDEKYASDHLPVSAVF